MREGRRKRGRERRGGEGNESDLIGVALSGRVSKMQQKCSMGGTETIVICGVDACGCVGAKRDPQKQSNNRARKAKSTPNQAVRSPLSALRRAQAPMLPPSTTHSTRAQPGACTPPRRTPRLPYACTPHLSQQKSTSRGPLPSPLAKSRSPQNKRRKEK